MYPVLGSQPRLWIWIERFLKRFERANLFKEVKKLFVNFKLIQFENKSITINSNPRLIIYVKKKTLTQMTPYKNQTVHEKKKKILISTKMELFLHKLLNYHINESKK